MNHNIKFQKVLLMDFPWVQDKQLSLTKFLGTESPQDRCYCTRIPMMSYALLCVEFAKKLMTVICRRLPLRLLILAVSLSCSSSASSAKCYLAKLDVSYLSLLT